MVHPGIQIPIHPNTKFAFEYQIRSEQAVVVQADPFHRQAVCVDTFRVNNALFSMIADVPDGSYKVTAWHEGYKTLSKPVTVAKDARVDFTLSK